MPTDNNFVFENSLSIFFDIDKKTFKEYYPKEILL